MTTAKKPLTDAKVRDTKTPGTYPEGSVRGLSLVITATGARSWRLRYWIDGKEYVHTLGRYYIAKTGMPVPADHMSLVAARAAAEAAKASARQGTHPKEQKKAQQAARKADRELTFRVVAAEFVEHNMTANGWSASTEKGHRYALAAINGIIGDVPVKRVDTDHIKAILRPYQESSPKRPTAERYALSVVKRVLAFAKTSRYISENVATGTEGLLSKRKKGEPRSQTNHAAILDPVELGAFLRKLEAHPLHSPSWYGLRLLTMLPVRPGELASMRWKDLDLEAGWWVYTMPKVSKRHHVPLPQQAVAILQELKQRRMGQAEYVLPSRLDPDKPMHPESMRLLLTEQLGYGVGTVICHGWRATWRTCGKKHLKIDPDVLELAMGHETKDPLGTAYNRDDLLEERTEAAQLYANWLERLKNGDATNGAP
ncbi:tyrosine-type recombinase/integrase [Pseudomonas sp. Marseille-P9655]|uniref:tyrosine-type recombinase/integrase n=1 Tax=Pseudomonas sp. Marseille-P9655 TaxID=2866591 RepID=UPI001CE4B5F1|nr:site-specific integrase [Pseudomonas sp. Marseille-P9655]